jgi:hypothetical protein
VLCCAVLCCAVCCVCVRARGCVLCCVRVRVYAVPFLFPRLTFKICWWEVLLTFDLSVAWARERMVQVWWWPRNTDKWRQHKGISCLCSVLQTRKWASNCSVKTFFFASALAAPDCPCISFLSLPLVFWFQAPYIGTWIFQVTLTYSATVNVQTQLPTSHSILSGTRIGGIVRV